MDLETPTTAVCPLCNDERVELGLNKNDRPKFTCSTFKTTVNLRGSQRRRNEFLAQQIELAESDGAEPSGAASHEGGGSGDGDESSVEDLLGLEKDE